MAERRGTRCTICVGCGKCFEMKEEAPPSQSWTGNRCEVCVGCGKCLQAWGLAAADGDEIDAQSGPTNWADAFKVMDPGTAAPPPPVPGAPGVSALYEDDVQCDVITGATVYSQPACDDAVECDTVTGATPGVASACKELGLDNMEALGKSLGIKPPGVA